MHIGLLWGLEVLAWSPVYLARVALVLANLARIDPGGRWVNRPINSLGAIFRWRYPGTTASLDQHLAAIDLLLDREPEIGWRLLVKLLPSIELLIAHPTARPRWRDFGDVPADVLTTQEQITAASAIVDRALRHVDREPQRWQTILDSLRAFNTTQRETSLRQLEGVVQVALSADTKSELRNVIREFVSRHRTFQDASWAVPESVLNRLEAILPQLDPSDLIERHQWLFDDWLPPVPLSELAVDARSAHVEELRAAALHDILAAQGIDGVIELGVRSRYPAAIADTVVAVLNGMDALRDLVERAVLKRNGGLALASFVSGRAREVYGESWSYVVHDLAIRHVCPTDVTASLLLWWPDEETTWDVAASLGVEDVYWRNKPIRALTIPPEARTREIGRLIAAGRAPEALARFTFQLESMPTSEVVRLFDAALDQLARVETIEELGRLNIHSYDIGQVLGHLRWRVDLPHAEVAKREYRAIPLLGPVPPPELVLHDVLVEDPNLFVELVCDVFRPSHEDVEHRVEPTQEEQARAQVGYLVLQGMTKLPGQGEASQIDEDALLAWIMAVREKARAADRAEMADLKIGELLAHAPHDPKDEGWPHHAVRNAIEKLSSEGSKDIEDGVVNERQNMRGVYTKALDEGGAQERHLASQCRDWAQKCRATWPRVASVLDRIANDWDLVARREDDWAEQRKLV